MPITTIAEALIEALELLEYMGYDDGGDVHDNLENALSRLQQLYPEIANLEVGK